SPTSTTELYTLSLHDALPIWVRQAIVRTMDQWLEMGVDGLRLDAIPYLYEREGTNCENLPETHAFLRELRAHIDRRFGDRMLLRSEEHTSELQSLAYLVCRLL